MKKIFTLFIVFLLVITLASCVEEDVEISIIVYSEDPTQMVTDLEGLPELLASELQELGVLFSRVVVQSSNDISVIESSLENGTVDMAIMNPNMVQSTSLKMVLSVTQEEMNHPDNPIDHTTYQNAVVVSDTTSGESFKTLYETTATFTDLNGLNVCFVDGDQTLVEEFAISLGASSIDDITINEISSTQNEVYENLENGTCDLGVVTLEDIYGYRSLWSDNDRSVYEDLTTIYYFTPEPYDAFYTIETANVTVTNGLVQSFIQISAHRSNRELLTALGHGGYVIPQT